MSEWKECKLGEVVSFGNGKVRPKEQGNTPVYGGNGILDYCDSNNYNNETIIIGRVGAYCGSVYYENKPIWISDNALAAKPKGKNDAKFFYYFIKNLKLNDFAEGSSHPLVTQTLLNSIDIVVTKNIEEQKRIAGVLSSLDDKIDLLNNQNKTLEAMAEAFFRHHFIDNPNPKWDEIPLSKVADFLNGLACQNIPPLNNTKKLPVLKIKELSSGINLDSDWASNEIDPKYIVENGDVIFAWSATLMVKIWNGERCVLNQHLFKVTSIKYPKWFYYLWCKYYLNEFKAIAASHATTMGHIKRGDLDTAIVSIPTEKDFIYMTEQMQPILEKQIANNKQILTLTKLRNTLLPNLINRNINLNG